MMDGQKNDDNDDDNYDLDFLHPSENYFSHIKSDNDLGIVQWSTKVRSWIPAHDSKSATLTTGPSDASWTDRGQSDRTKYNKIC